MKRPEFLNPPPILWRFGWTDVRAGWIDEQRDTRHPGPWAPCGATDYRLGWFASWVVR